MSVATPAEAPNSGKSALINSILARCLLEPRFLSRLECAPESALSEYRLDDATRRDVLQLEFQRVRNFGGFITQVQHNYIWEWFPYTRALLHHFRLEIEVFADYRDTYLAAFSGRSATRNEKILKFTSFLDQYLAARTETWAKILRDLLRHETTVWTLRTTTTASPGEPRTSADDVAARDTRAFGSLVPCLRGQLQVQQYTFNPLATVAMLDRQCFEAEQIPTHHLTLAYWTDSPSSDLRIFEVDVSVMLVLSQIDNRRSIRAIACRLRRLVSGPVRLRELRPFFDLANTTGFVALGAHASCSGR